MSFAFICLAFLAWHLTWNMALNKARNMKWVSIEQVVVSMIVAIILQSIAGYNAWAAILLVFFGNLAYYINLVNIRFFGYFIEGSQIKQFLFSKETAAVSGAMLFQAASRLIKLKDACFLLLSAGVLTALLFLDKNTADPLWKWWVLTCSFLVIIVLTLKQRQKLKSNTIDSHLFGMFFSYYFNWLMTRKRRLEQEQLYKSFASKSYEEEEDSTKEDLLEDEWFGKFGEMNVILIQLESFQQFLLHHKVEGQEITPFMNRLARENIVFTDIFSQYAQGHTCDAELASLHSLYPLKNEVVNYKHYDKNYHGMPKILRKHGYQAAAYHGYKGDFYNRRTMMNTHGFESFSSEEDYISTDRASSWMSDFSFFEQSVTKIKKLKEPFFAFMISLTSHFPFKLEEKHWGLTLSKEVPESLASYYQSVNYTDRALQHFYDCLEREGLLENTVLAFYGDHEGITPEHLPALYDELDIPQSNLLKDTNRMSVAKVPFIIASGDSSRQITLMSDNVGSTMDVGQTLLHLLGLPKISYGMGASLLATSNERVIPLAQHPLGSFVTQDTICYASDSGDYLNSVIFDRRKKMIVLPVSGTNKDRYEHSKQQVTRSEYLIVNNLLVSQAPKDGEDRTDEVVKATFTPNVERLLNIVDDDAIIIPISLSLDQGHMIGQINALNNMSKMERFYKNSRKKNIRFYSTLDLDQNDKPIYFEDFSYSDILIEKGYTVEIVNPISLPLYLQAIPDHSLIIAVVKDDGSSQFHSDFVKEMEKYGINKLNVTKYHHSYINLIYKNKGFVSLYEEVSEQPIEKSWETRSLLNGVALPFDLQVISKGALVGNMSEIIINGLSCSLNLRGVNIAVADMDTGKVFEMARVDTFSTIYMDTGMYRAVRKKLSQEVEL